MIIVTNRNLQPNRGPTERFGDGFLGKVPDELRLAEAHKRGRTWTVNLFPDRMPHPTKKKKVWASERVFLDLQVRMRQRQRGCLFFIHGFNNDFESVLERARGLEQAYDVEVVAFTWPANGRDRGRVGGALSYKSDKRDAIRSVQALDRVFEKLNFYLRHYEKETLACGQSMNLIMHSMGNYLFKHLMKSNAYQKETSMFDNIILAAADVNNHDHAQWLDRVAFRKRLYVTINENDGALRISRMKTGERQRARLGHFTQNLHARNAVYLDFTHAKGVGTSHAYFEGAPVKLNPKIKRLFKEVLSGRPVEQRLDYNPHSRTYQV